MNSTLAPETGAGTIGGYRAWRSFLTRSIPMGLWSWIKRLFGKKEEESGPTSLVFLLAEPRYLDVEIVRNAVRKAFGVELDQGPDSTEFVTGGDGLPTYFVVFQQKFLLVHNFSMPYFDDKEAIANKVPDLRMRKAIFDHKAWLSVDAVGEPSAEYDPYPTLGKLLAELADRDCLAILAPALGRMNPWEPDLEAKLRGGRPLDAVCEMTQVPVIPVADDDPLMQAAVAEARRRWPEFVEAFERRRPDQTFAVKAPFREGDAMEFMWLQVGSIEHDTVFGTLDNDPVDLKKIRAGSRVQIQAKDLNDWLYTDGEDHRGGFTIEAVRKAAERKSK